MNLISSGSVAITQYPTKNARPIQPDAAVIELNGFVEAVLAPKLKIHLELAGKASGVARQALKYGTQSRQDLVGPIELSKTRFSAMRSDGNKQFTAFTSKHRIKMVPRLCFLELAAASMRLHGIGGCVELSGAAFEWLNEQGVRPLDLMGFTSDSHVFVVVGRQDGSNSADPSTWGPDAVICDPWANKVYPVSEWSENQRSENNVPLAYGAGDGHYLCGVLASCIRLGTKMDDPWMRERKAVVQEVVNTVRSHLARGSTAAPDAKLSPQEMQSMLRQRIQFFEEASAATIKSRNLLRLDFSDTCAIRYDLLRQHQFGTADDLASSAFHLFALKDIRPIDYCKIDGMHSLVVVGRSPGSDPNDMASWGGDAIVCDPWANQVYLLADYFEMQRQEHNVRSLTAPEIPHLSGALVSVEQLASSDANVSALPF